TSRRARDQRRSKLLAYVFSHRPASDADAQAYEDALRRFHSELAAGRPAGFVASTTYRFDDGYSDWYLVEDSAALDVLNEAAVSGARTEPHDMAARMASWGSGKLLSLTQGEADLDAPHEAALAKQELKELAITNVIAAACFAAAAILALLALLVAVPVIVVVLVPWHWEAAAVWAVAYILIAAVLALYGRARMKVTLPQKTINSLKETKEWALKRMRSTAR